MAPPKKDPVDLRKAYVRVLVTPADLDRLRLAARADHAGSVSAWLATLGLRRADELAVPVQPPPLKPKKSPG